MSMKTIDLSIANDGLQRLLVGLSWNAKELSNEEKREQILSGVKDVAFGDIFLLRTNIDRIHEKMDLEGRDKDDHNFDLDLCCLTFDKDGNILSLVDPDAWNAIDESGKVYHSGDNMTGEGDIDDEQIYIDINKLPKEIHEIFIFVQSDCKHPIHEINDPKIHLTYSKSNEKIIESAFDKKTEDDQYGYVFCRIYRNGANWKLEHIDGYCAFEENWAEYFQKFRS